MASTFLQKDFGSAGNRKIFTFSTWYKFTSGNPSGNKVLFSAGSASNNYCQIRIKSTADYIQLEDETASGVNASIYTSAQFRDPTAWSHFVVRVDTTQSTAADRVRFYKDGVLLSTAGGSQPNQNTDLQINNNIGHAVGTLWRGSNSGGEFSGYLAQTIFCDGQTLAPTSFGQYDSNGVWTPISTPSVTYGSNGFKIEYKGSGTSADSSGFGADTSGNNNHFATTNFSTNGNNVKDAPINNFAILNKLASQATITEGGLKSVTTDGERMGGPSTLGVRKGKWYMEFKITDINSNNMTVGVGNDQGVLFSDFRENVDWWNASNSYAYENNGNKRSTGVNSSYGASYTTGDIIGIALDMDNRKLYFSKNGTFQDSGDPTSGSTGTGAAFSLTENLFNKPLTYFFTFGDNSSAAGVTVEANFGNPSFTIASGNADANGYGNFEYAVPSGYYALCTKNLGAYGG